MPQVVIGNIFEDPDLAAQLGMGPPTGGPEHVSRFVPRINGAGEVLLGATLHNPCFDYVDYLEQRGEVSASDARDMRDTYSSRDQATEQSCYFMLKERQKSDRRSNR